MNRKLLAGACALAVLTLAGCGSIPQGADRINIITEQEAKANNCRLLDKAGSVSAVMVNGYKRNTQVTLTNFSELTVELAEHSEWDDLLMGQPQ